MKTLFISDLHLEPAHPGITRLFLNFLQNQAIEADALYILGDLFAAWIGDDDTSEFNQQMIAALRKLTDKNIPVYFMHGNRDFLIGDKFLQQTGCKLLVDPTVIDLYGTPTLLMHGDTLCTDDKAYLRFRRFAHWVLPQKIFLALPLNYRKKFSIKLAGASHEKQKNYLHKIDANQNEITRVMQQHNVSLLIHGHTHNPNIHHFNLNNQPASRIVLSDWQDNKGNVLVCTPDNKRSLEYFS